VSERPTVLLAPVTVSRDKAAALLDVGETYFKQTIAPELPVIRLGRRKLYRVRDLERWAEENAEAPMVEQVGEGRT